MSEKVVSIISYLARASEAHHLIFLYEYTTVDNAVIFRFEHQHRDTRFYRFCKAVSIFEIMECRDPLDLAELIFEEALKELSRTI